MKVRIGYGETVYGTIEDTPEGLRHKGDVEQLRAS
jgi:hypothetical protein